METVIASNARELGIQASRQAATHILEAIESNGQARVIVATGASQFETLAALVDDKRIDWTKVTGFHLDEYIGLEATHPASFRGYLRERFVEKIAINQFHYINADAGDPAGECERLGKLLNEAPIDVALVGIGENAHLAFNDPPADFETTTAYLIVELDEACRRQQLGEGWFPTFEDVPTQAISMSVQQIMKTKCIVCSVPDERKALAVANSIEGPVTPTVPASILQRHGNTTIYLDPPAASQLKQSNV